MFEEVINEVGWDAIHKRLDAVREQEVDDLLSADHHLLAGNLDAFLTLISPAAASKLDTMAAWSSQITQQRFGKNMHLFIPMYLSNECQNICTYCGFSFTNKIPRKTLSDAEILAEIAILKAHGFDSILLVTGEANQTVGVEYLLHAVRLVKQHFSQVSIEVQPLEQNEYELLKEEGVYAVLVYQETYHRELYKHYHPKGKKANYGYRLDTPDRLGKAGMHKIGLGVLLGLADWRVDSYFNALHLAYLQKTYWQTRYSVSFPRIRPHEGDFIPESLMSEKALLQLICAYRICFPDVELSLSSRERALFRDAVIPYGVTSMSAGSETDPGGYANPNKNLKQFETHDTRSPQEMVSVIKSRQYEAVWKDWDAVLF